MNSRIRFIITTLLGSHLFLVPALLTSQLRSAPPENEVAQSPAVSGASTAQSTSTGSAAQQTASPKQEQQPAANEGEAVIEEVIQQQLQSAADTNTPRPPPTLS